MKRRVRLAHWLFDRSRIARTAFVLGIWPIVYVTDRWGLLGRVDPPARLRDGLFWAWHGDLPRVPTIPTIPNDQEERPTWTKPNPTLTRRSSAAACAEAAAARTGRASRAGSTAPAAPGRRTIPGAPA